MAQFSERVTNGAHSMTDSSLFKRIMTRHFNDKTAQTRIMKAVKRVANAILIVCGLFLLLEMILVTLPKIESMQYWMGRCNVTDVKLNTVGGQQLQCPCTGHTSKSKCMIYYPCIQIFVSFNNHEAVRRALVVRDRRRVAEHCSYKLRNYECRTKEDAYQHVERFREKWGLINSSYLCFHSSRHRDKVTLSNEAPSIALAFSLTLFPIIGIAVSLVMLHFKEEIGLMILRKHRGGTKQGYLPLAFVGEGDPPERESERAE